MSASDRGVHALAPRTFIARAQVDAHADANTPATSPSLHYHGMPAAHLMGWFEQQPAGFGWLKPGVLPESSLAYIGLRDIDIEEAKLLRASKASCRRCPRAKYSTVWQRRALLPWLRTRRRTRAARA